MKVIADICVVPMGEGINHRRFQIQSKNQFDIFGNVC